MVDEAIGILSNTDFYHYTDSLPVYLESLHNYETDQSVIFDLVDSTVFFSYYAHYAAWNRWLKYNYSTREVSIYKEADPRLSDPFLAKLNDVYGKTEACDWRDSANVRSLVNAVAGSGINNYFTLDFLSTKYLNYYHLPAQARIYADRMIEKYPDIITGYFNRGRALEAENKPEEAINKYMQALASKIQCEYYLAATYERLALTYASLGKKNQAAEYAAKSLDIHKQYWVPDHLKERIQKLEKMMDKSD
jgi:tetratricopeptide (TPR) repeat protein